MTSEFTVVWCDRPNLTVGSTDWSQGILRLVKGKAVLFQACSGPEGSRKLRFPDYMTTAQDGGKVVSPTHRPSSPPGNAPVTYFCWGTAVAQWLRCCATNRKVAGSIPASVSGFFIDIKSFRSHHGPGVDSASNRNSLRTSWNLMMASE